LKARCVGTKKEVAYTVFERYDVEAGEDRPSYAELGKALGLSEAQVTNHLAWARRSFREEVLVQLRAVTASEEEFRMEARVLLGYSGS
jgi:hypothetical protein